MLENLGRTLDILTSFKADELIGAVVVGLLLAMVSAGIYNLSRRRGADAGTAVTLISFVASMASMFGVTLYLGLAGGGADGAETVASRVFTVGPPSLRHEPPPSSYPPVSYRGDYPGVVPGKISPPAVKASEIMRSVDQNRDRRLSPDEAATFVEQVSRHEDGTVGISELAWNLHLAATGLRAWKPGPPRGNGPPPTAGRAEGQADVGIEPSGDGGFARTQ